MKYIQRIENCMKKILILILLAVAGLSAHAIPLFPFFVDVAGDYDEKTPPELAVLQIPFMYSKKPASFSTLASADEFLKDVLPFSSEKIDRKEEVMKNKVKRVTYSSPMTDGRISILYLIEIPGNGFFAAYNEIPGKQE